MEKLNTAEAINEVHEIAKEDVLEALEFYLTKYEDEYSIKKVFLEAKIKEYQAEINWLRDRIIRTQDEIERLKNKD